MRGASAMELAYLSMRRSTNPAASRRVPSCKRVDARQRVEAAGVVAHDVAHDGKGLVGVHALELHKIAPAQGERDREQRKRGGLPRAHLGSQALRAVKIPRTSS